MIELPDREVTVEARLTYRAEKRMTVGLFEEIETVVRKQLYALGASGAVHMEVNARIAAGYNVYTWTARAPYTDIPARLWI